MEDKKGKKRWFLAVAVILLLVLSYYVVDKRQGSNDSPSGKIKVVTTLFPLYDMARYIGGDKAEVSLLLPPGVEAHAFEPSPSDIVKISQANVFAYIGPAMEPWAQDILDSTKNDSRVVVNTSSGINMMTDDDPEAKDHGGVDPHIWLDFDNAKKMATSIGEALAKADPYDSAYFSANTQKYIDGLSKLDNEYKAGLADCSDRTIVYGGHYAFGYLAKRYDLNYIAAQGLSPDSEPSPSDLIRLVDQINSQKIKTVFYEELTTPKIAETISSETGAKLILLSAAHNISKEDFDSGVTFFDIMEKNLAGLRSGLECR